MRTHCSKNYLMHRIMENRDGKNLRKSLRLSPLPEDRINYTNSVPDIFV